MLLEVRIVFTLGSGKGLERGTGSASGVLVIFCFLTWVCSLWEFIDLYAYDMCIFSMYYTLIKRFENKIEW